MTARANALVSATLESPTRGVIELRHDWRGRSVPMFVISGGRLRMRRLERLATAGFALLSGYHFPDDGVVEFVLDPADYPDFDFAATGLHVAGEFNDWRGADMMEWAMHSRTLAGRSVYA
jgi:hypothetical protein